MSGYQGIVEKDTQEGGVRYPDGRKEVKVYFPSGYTQYQPYVIGTDTTEGGPTAVAPTELAIGRRLCVPQGDTTSTAGWYWAAVEGTCTALVNGNSNNVAIGAYLELLTSGTTFVLSHATVPTVNAAAVSREAVTTDGGNAEVYLCGIPVQTANVVS